MTLANLLTLLLALGADLPFVLEKIQEAFAALKEIYDRLKPTTEGTLELVAPTDEELALEAQIAEALTAHGSQALFDGSNLRAIFAFAKQHPELIALLLSFLKK